MWQCVSIKSFMKGFMEFREAYRYCKNYQNVDASRIDPTESGDIIVCAANRH